MSRFAAGAAFFACTQHTTRDLNAHITNMNTRPLVLLALVCVAAR
jgi:hypothetical protein